MHGIGNDYIYVDIRNRQLVDLPSLSVKWSDRHKGIGSDGLVVIDHSDKADFSMRIFNADGSEAMMCGNASRCIGKYLYDKGLTDKETIKLETLSGVKILQLEVEDRKVKSVTVDMLEPRLHDASQYDEQTGLAEMEQTGRPVFVSMGNPH